MKSTALFFSYIVQIRWFSRSQQNYAAACKCYCDTSPSFLPLLCICVDMEYTVIFCLVLLNLCCAAHLSKPLASTSLLFWSFASEAAAVTEESSWQLLLAGAALVCSSWKVMAAQHKGGRKRCISCESQVVATVQQPVGCDTALVALYPTLWLL